MEYPTQKTKAAWYTQVAAEMVRDAEKKRDSGSYEISQSSTKMPMALNFETNNVFNSMKPRQESVESINSN